MEYYTDVQGYHVYKLDNNDRKLLFLLKGKPAFVAFVSTKTNNIFVMDEFFRFLPEERMFILFHEIGHIELQTSDEDACDKYAVEHFSNGEQLLADCNARSGQIRKGVLEELKKNGVIPENFVPKNSKNGRH